MPNPSFTSLSRVLAGGTAVPSILNVVVSSSDKYLIVFATRDDPTSANPHTTATWGVNSMTEWLAPSVNQAANPRGRQFITYILDVTNLEGTEDVVVNQPSRGNNILFSVATDGIPQFGAISSANCGASFASSSLLQGSSDFSQLAFLSFDNSITATDNYAHTELENETVSNIVAIAAHKPMVNGQLDSGWTGTAGNWTLVTIAVSTTNYLSSSGGGGGGWPIGVRL